MSRGRTTTRADVARRAGVSPPTVSLVLNGRGDEVRIAKATQERVLAAARSLRYVPNAAARAMRGQRHLTLGIIAHRPPTGLHVPVFEDFVMGAIERAADYAHTVKFLPPVRDDQESYDVLATLRDAQVDGILVRSVPGVFRTLVDWNVPAVFVGYGERVEDLPADQAVVTIDQRSGLRVAADQLSRRGDRQLGIVTGPPGGEASVPRVTSFLDSLQATSARPLTVAYATADDWFPEGGYRATTELLQRSPEVTLLHTGNDWMAIGALRAVHESGRRIPEDIAVLGYGDFIVAPHLQPSLSTIHWPLTELGTRGVDKLLCQLGIPPETPGSSTPDRPDCGHTILSTRFVARSSTGPG